MSETANHVRPDSPPLRSPRSRRLAWGGFAFLLVFHFALTLYSSPWLSPSADEPAHIRSGMTWMTHGRYIDAERAWWTPIDPLHPLMDMAPAAAARLGGQSPDYRDDPLTPFGKVRLARAANHLLGAALLAVLFLWGRALWGDAGGLLSAALFAFHPLFVAHSSIVSSDLYGALGGMTAAWATWRFFFGSGEPHRRFDRRFWLGGALVGLAFGFAIVGKISNLLFAAVIPATGAAAAWMQRKKCSAPLARTLAYFAAASLLPVAVGLCLGLLAYGWAGIDFPPISLAGREIKLPFGHGLAWSAWTAVRIDELIRAPVFFFGRRVRPAPEHFLIAWLLKTPPGVMALSIAGVPAAAWLIRRRPRFRSALFPLILCAGLCLYFIAQGFYFGLRHLMLPMTLLALLGGATAAWIVEAPTRSMRRGAVALVCLFAAWGGIETALASPWHLSYFNFFAGPPHRLTLVDSDRDWGQGLIALREWQRRHAPDEPIWLAYFGINRPEDYGVNYRGLPSPYSYARVDWDPGGKHFRPEQAEGIVAIGASQLGGVWLPAGRKPMDYYDPWREIEPDAIVGGSIFVYDLRATQNKDAAPETRERRPD